jgi:hypothetical protein
MRLGAEITNHRGNSTVPCFQQFASCRYSIKSSASDERFRYLKSLHAAMEYSNKLIAAAAAGFFSHIGFFIKGEHHNEAAKIMNVYLLLTAILVLIESLLPGVPLGFTTVATIVAAYAGALFSSMTVYRIFFHRLRKFPGPPVAAISKLWHVSNILDSKQYLMLDKLRESYGDFVRTG